MVNGRLHLSQWCALAWTRLLSPTRSPFRHETIAALMYRKGCARYAQPQVEFGSNGDPGEAHDHCRALCDGARPCAVETTPYLSLVYWSLVYWSLVYWTAASSTTSRFAAPLW